LLLSAGELARLMMDALGQADAAKRGDSQRLGVALPSAAIVEQR
jgi:hypothetical protein